MKNIEKTECLRGFGKFVLDGRTRRGLTQTQAAEILGIDQTYLSKIELGKRNVDLILAMQVCEALKLDLSDFIRGYM